ERRRQGDDGHGGDRRKANNATYADPQRLESGERRDRDRDQQSEEHTAEQHGLRDELETTQQNAGKSKNVEERVQCAPTSRTKNVISPCVTCPSMDRTC